MKEEKIDPNKVKQAQELISEARKIVITCHKSPDGDAIGSSLALYHYLKQKGKEVGVIMPDPDADFLHWVPGHDVLINYEGDHEAGNKLVREADLIFSLDYNTLSRTGELENPLQAAVKKGQKFILIDHHQQPDDYPEVSISDTSACSTAQLLYSFFAQSGDVEMINKDIGTCLYLGIMTDTGSFRFSSVEPFTHRVAADLIERGVEHHIVHQQVYDTNLEGRLKLIGHALSNKLVVMKDFHTAYISLNKKELDEHDYRPGDTEGLVNQALSVKGVNLAAFIREGNNQVKMSFRSSGSFDVNKFARKHFDGGGHKNAAGGASQQSFDRTIENFEEAVKEYKDELNY